MAFLCGHQVHLDDCSQKVFHQLRTMRLRLRLQKMAPAFCWFLCLGRHHRPRLGW